MLKLPQSIGFSDRRGDLLFIKLTDNRVSGMFSIAFPNVIVRREAQSARIDDDDDAVFERGISAVRQIAARLLELNLTVHGMKHSIVVRLFEPTGEIALKRYGRYRDFAEFGMLDRSDRNSPLSDDLIFVVKVAPVVLVRLIGAFGLPFVVGVEE